MLSPTAQAWRRSPAPLPLLQHAGLCGERCNLLTSHGYVAFARARDAAPCVTRPQVRFWGARSPETRELEALENRRVTPSAPLLSRVGACRVVIKRDPAVQVVEAQDKARAAEAKQQEEVAKRTRVASTPRSHPRLTSPGSAAPPCLCSAASRTVSQPRSRPQRQPTSAHTRAVGSEAQQWQHGSNAASSWQTGGHG